ncbi:MAG: hydantoinase/oxoprolinase family protein [Pseudomonadota bacterium]
MPFRIGADVGGTFTDVVLLDDDSTKICATKVLTTPEQPDEAIVQGVVELLEAQELDGNALSHIIHGTTLFTNALIERKGAKTALITTKGFRDSIEIGREHRYDMYDLHMQKPKSLAPRYLRFELDERVLADGSVLRPLEGDDVHQLVGKLKQEGVEAVAVCLIHSYANDAHEKRVGTILAQALPDLAVSLSHEIVPEIREYDRTSTTLANVYVKPIAGRYLNRLQSQLGDTAGFDKSLFVMQSNGGLCEAADAAASPILCVESGPAAGGLAAAYYGKLLGHSDLLSFDMGGTTAKACVIVDSEPLVANDFEVDRQYQFKKGSGLPVKVPVIEMIEIGTGGGSIAEVDAMKRLNVGPHSAGAVPGPVAYGRGGDRPTVTDADLRLGYLDPEFFLGGTMRLDLERSREAIHDKIGAPLGLDEMAAAWGIHQIANENMASAARIHAIERGKDVRKFPIFAFGGAGPVHAFGVAQILRAPSIIYPLNAGVMSAIGFMTAPLSLQYSRSFPTLLDTLDIAGVNALLKEMEKQGREKLEKTIPAEDVGFRRFADIRYRKQGYEVRTVLPDGPLTDESAAVIRKNFEAAYREIYGHTMNAPIEIISWRVIAHGPNPVLNLPTQSEEAGATADSALKSRRAIYLPKHQEMREVPVYDRYQLPAGVRFKGPVIIEERESTAVINGDAEIRVDAFNNLIVDIAQE